MKESYEDREWVVKGPHVHLEKRRDFGDIEKTVLDLLGKRGKLRLSQLWREFHCHLWEISLVLKNQKMKGSLKRNHYDSRDACIVPQTYSGTYLVD